MNFSFRLSVILLATVSFYSLPAFTDEATSISKSTRNDIIANFPRTGLNTTPEDAMMLRILVESRNAQRGIEVGSATGYGAIIMGIAFERTGGHLFTLEIDPEMVKTCNEYIRKMGLEKSVTCVEGDALKTLPEAPPPVLCHALLRCLT